MALRLIRFTGLVVVVVVLNFFLPRILPGGPAAGGSGETAMLLPEASRQVLIDTYHLDRPVAEQFARYLDGLRRADLGRALSSHRPVASILFERLPWTLGLAGGAVVLAAAFGGVVGWASVWYQRRRDVRLAAVATVGLGALPEFFVGMVLIVVFASRLRLFPAGGAATPFVDGQPFVHRLMDMAWHAVLPGTTLVLVLVPVFALIMRSGLLPVLGEPYLVAARAKGLPSRRIAWHAIRNALPPVVTLFGLRLGAVVAGAAVVERVFAYPGLGWLMFEAVMTRDYPLMQGLFLASSMAVLTVNLALDCLAGWLDPRTAHP